MILSEEKMQRENGRLNSLQALRILWQKDSESNQTSVKWNSSIFIALEENKLWKSSSQTHL